MRPVNCQRVHKECVGEAKNQFLFVFFAVFAGDHAAPIFKYLKSQKSGFMWMKRIKWNFSKFLCNNEGVPVERYAYVFSKGILKKDP